MNCKKVKIRNHFPFSRAVMTNVTEQLFSHLVVVLAVLGTLINISAFVTLHRKQAPTLFHRLLKFLSVYDLFVVLGGALTYGLPSIWPYYYESIFPLMAPVLAAFVHVVLLTSVYTTIIISLERYVRICYLCQMRRSELLKETNLRYFFCALIILPILFYIPKLFEFQLDKRTVLLTKTLNCTQVRGDYFGKVWG